MARNIRDWQYEVHKTAKNKGWWDPQTEEKQKVAQKLAVLAILHSNLSHELERARTGDAHLYELITREQAESMVENMEPSRVLLISKLALIHSEVTEAVESVLPDSLWDAGYDLQYAEGSKKPEGLLSELADVVIRCFDLAGYLGIELSRGMSVKHRFNKTRKHRHGGKLA